jgi:ATP-grasp domain, R2K clade family 3
MIKLHWIVDEDIIGEHNVDVPDYIRSLEHKFTGLSATKNFPKFKEDLSEYINVFHGSFEELRKVKNILHTPGICTYGLGPSILRSHYTSYLPREWFLNANATMTTWGHFCLNNIHYFSRNDEIFIRPDSGFKVFTGQVVDFSNFIEQKTVLEKFSSVVPETIIWTSPSLYINREFRVWICGGKVVTAAEYSWKYDDVAGDIPNSIYDMAKKIAEYPWQIDRSYVCDIHLAEDLTTSVIEFNSFSCSGLYNCDAKLLFKTVSDDIIKEWDE